MHLRREMYGCGMLFSEDGGATPVHMFDGNLRFGVPVGPRAPIPLMPRVGCMARITGGGECDGRHLQTDSRHSSVRLIV
jgi:hypothetical protein